MSLTGFFVAGGSKFHCVSKFWAKEFRALAITVSFSSSHGFFEVSKVDLKLFKVVIDLS